MKIYGYIYKFTNRINGKIYIGKRIYEEVDENYFGSGVYFKHAKEKYGIENFKFEILQWCYNNEELCEAEKWHIAHNNCLAKNGHGYNLASGGQGGNPYAGYTEKEMKEFKRKVGEASKESWENKSEEEKNEIKQKISKSNKMRWQKLTEEESNALKKRNSKIAKELWKNPEYIKKREIGQKKRFERPEEREKVRERFNKAVMGINEETKECRYFESMIQASEVLGLKKSAVANISKCCSGEKRSAYGWVWTRWTDVPYVYF